MLITEIVQGAFMVDKGTFVLGTFATYAELVLAAGQSIGDSQVGLMAILNWSTGPLVAFILLSSNKVGISLIDFAGCSVQIVNSECLGLEETGIKCRCHGEC
jgi:hypothetical protein